MEIIFIWQTLRNCGHISTQSIAAICEHIVQIGSLKLAYKCFDQNRVFFILFYATENASV